MGYGGGDGLRGEEVVFSIEEGEREREKERKRERGKEGKRERGRSPPKRKGRGTKAESKGREKRPSYLIHMPDPGVFI